MILTRSFRLYSFIMKRILSSALRSAVYDARGFAVALIFFRSFPDSLRLTSSRAIKKLTVVEDSERTGKRDNRYRAV